MTASQETLTSRLVSGLLAFGLLYVVVKIGTLAVVPVCLAIALLGLRELVDMFRHNDIDVRYKILMFWGAVLIVASIPRLPDVPWVGGSWREVMLSGAVLNILILEVIKPCERPLERVVYSIFALLYIPWLLGYFVLLRETPSPLPGFGYLFMPLLASFANDAGSFFFGKKFGKKKLAPEISPAKTIEGAIGGMVFSFVMVFLVGRVIDDFLLAVSIWDALLFSLLVSSAAQLGDLAESLIKRAVKVKDSGSFLPGHGGVLDRIDSLLFSVPITYFFVTMVVTKV